ncbi:riboflavin biosynthesis protein RibF [mine drainage metagenome]|uniref:Bifunctional riboflavin kinase/FMN adenylyltransferase n=1 Tax=mine drainage metagenome TaxID=410659 RepID=T0YF41_9ZZZZ
MKSGKMILERDVQNRGPCVVTVGGFDGIHRGHQALIHSARERAMERALPLTLLTFDPLPQEFLNTLPPARLTTLREKLLALHPLGVNRVVSLRFDAALAATSAHDFVRTILIQSLGAETVAVGENFRFGHRRLGDVDLLERLLARAGCELRVVTPEEAQGARISSTRIRESLARGALDEARTLLGHPYRMTGHVIHGQARGRTIGYPTVNLLPHRRRAAVRGIFAVRVHGAGPVPYNGVASLGIRPGLDDGRELLEVHLLDWTGDLYGRLISVEFVAFLREERRFDDWADLRRAIDTDVREARSILASRPLSPSEESDPWGIIATP